MKLVRLLLIMLWVVMPAQAQNGLSGAAASTEFTQRLDGQVPRDLSFQDEHGAPVTLSQFHQPVVLVLAYYGCPSLCSLVLNGLLESALDLKLEAGRDFQIVVVSIDPRETPALAGEKKATYARRYGHGRAGEGWHFWTGAEESIRPLAESVGFHYAYDPASKQYAHPSGLVVLTPEGRISRYFAGIEFPPRELRLALVNAGNRQIGTLTDRFFLLCFHYNPVTGKYGLVIHRVLQSAAAATLLGLAGMIVHLQRRERRLRLES